MKMLFLIFSLLLAKAGMASDYMLAMGAGGEPAKIDTIFDNSIKNLATYVRGRSDLSVDVALNGGHSVTEGIIQNDFPPSVRKSNFYESDYNRLIDKYVTMLNSDQIKAGDQLMIYIDSHGAEKDSESTTHKIATAGGAASNLQNLEGSTLVDLDKLKKIRNLAKIKKVKLAIIDGSCHSGNTLKLADDNTCVISSSGANHFGYTSFTNHLTGSFGKGKNLEDLFLEARQSESTLSFPMISTSAGLVVNDKLYEKITPFLYSYTDRDDKFLPYLSNNNSETQMCLSNQNYKELMAMIDKIEDMNTVTSNLLWWSFKTKGLDLGELKRLLAEYKKTLDDSAIKLRDMHSERLKKIETISVRAVTPGYIAEYSTQFSWSDLLSMDYEKLITETNNRASSEKDDNKKNELMGLLDLYKKSKRKKEEIIRDNPDLATIKDRQLELMRSIQSTTNIASSIALEERKLYQAMYQQTQKEENNKASNPCREFKL